MLPVDLAFFGITSRQIQYNISVFSSYSFTCISMYFQGNTYGIWKLSDLGPNTANECVVLFLFGDIYKEHWKTTEGSVVALLNASLLPAKEVKRHNKAT